MKLFVILPLMLLITAIKGQQNKQRNKQGTLEYLDSLVTEMKIKFDALGVKVDSLEKELAKANERIDHLMENSDYSDDAAVGRKSSSVAPLIVRPQTMQAQYRTCYEFYTATRRYYKEIGHDHISIKSGMFFIDLDGLGVGEQPIYVYCNMTDGTTSIGHDIADESLSMEMKCSAAGCFSRTDVTYDISPNQLELLAHLSSQCSQKIKIECASVRLEHKGDQHSWWLDRKGTRRYFWAGNQSDAMAIDRRNSHTCQCGLDDDMSCLNRHLKCNCDSLLLLSLSDEGLLTDKDLLPIIGLHFGQAVDNASILDKFKLGRFNCSGHQQQYSPSNNNHNNYGIMPTNCDQLQSLGHRLNGFYTVKSPSNDRRLNTVYCDFTNQQKNYETIIGINSIKTSSGVYFYVQRNSIYNSTGTTIPYELERLNIGGAINMKTGVFTAPTSGRYFLSFNALPYEIGGNWVYLRVNGVTFGQSHVLLDNNSMPVSATLNLQKGDRVDMFLGRGSIFDNDINHFTQFSGILLEEDLASLG